ncbi:MAG: phosphatase PAP2 family protein [Candidatus Levybacteria bacterium]|nr:phosphatase PAP2 family protein [Candidatus Levybacteria bacterium]
MPKGLRIFFLGAGVFLLFILFSYLVARELLVQFDFDTTVRLQDRIPRRFDDPFSFISDFGKFEVSIVILVALLVIARKVILGVVAFGLFGLLHIFELFGKYFVDQHPPPEFMIRTRTIIDFPQFHVRSEFSYPSGHAARAAFLSVILVYLILNSKLKKEYKYVLLGILVVYDFLMFLSRPYLGEHWATDVIGGIFLGSSLALIAVAFGKIRLFGKGIITKVRGA